jgi:hypothetical protein
MTPGQRVGVVLTVVADALWVVVVLTLLATPRDESASIGAGVLGLLALPRSIVAAVPRFLKRYRALIDTEESSSVTHLDQLDSDCAYGRLDERANP